MRYFVKIVQIKEKIDILEKELEIINENIEKLGLIKNDLEWQGEAANVFYLNYDKYFLDMKKTRGKIIKSILFLGSFYDIYSEEYIRLKTKYANLLDEEDYRYGKIY